MSTTQLSPKPKFWAPLKASSKFLISSLFILQLLFPVLQWASPSPKGTEQEGYLVQFSDISLSELVRFVSDMTGHNFVYSEADLIGRITLTAEQPVTSEELLSLLFRILHVNKMEVFKEHDHFLIFPATRAKSATPILSPSDSIHEADNFLVTKVFQVRHTDISKVKDLVAKIISPGALIEVLNETRCLIVNDVHENIARVDQLLRSIEHENFDVGFQTYFVKKMSAEQLKEVATSILPPFTKGLEVTLVASPTSQAIHIVAAKSLMPKILSILKGIDVEGGLLQKATPSGPLSYQAPFVEEETEKISQAAQKLLKTIQSNFEEKITFKLQEREKLVREIEEGQRRIQALETKIIALEGHPELQGEKDETTESQREASSLLKNELENMQLQHGVTVKCLKDCDQILNDLQNELVLVRKYIPEAKVEEEELIPETTPLSQEENKGHSNAEAYQLRFEGMEELALLREELKEMQRTQKEQEEKKEEHPEQGQILSYRIQYKSGKSLTDALSVLSSNLSANKLAPPSLISALQSVQFVEQSNQLLFLGDHYTLERVQDILAILDIPIRQVLVELLIVDASIEKALEFGIDIGALFRGTEGNWAGFGNSNQADSGLTEVLLNAHGTEDSIAPEWAGQGSAFSSGVIGRFITYQGKIFSTLGSLVQALKADGNIHVVMNPKILSEENKSASFFVGETTRIKTNTQKGEGAGLIVSGFEMRDIGSSIQVTSRINNDQTISLNIQQEISESHQLPGSSDMSAVLPVTKTSRTQTEVLVPNRGFVILSGITHEKVRKTKATIPFLGSIPFISALFSKSVHTTDKRNLLVFIRAQIIYDANDTQSILNASKKVFDEISSHFDSFEEKFNLFSPPVL
ncbi:type II secretion system protein GspD [Candidatus Similichlamydia laticola]|uniref:General secretion pathway protein D n=1 Tax=Candidatus Similichlamydia laticola TaxID=2170265 RepID=A0A369KD51_9BACT|nr:hypothetical protein [Candidatus Similichlamydia laticola]RDB31828.1 General secretion pathway protein D [Candidatus Similichlamydia laticola]